MKQPLLKFKLRPPLKLPYEETILRVLLLLLRRCFCQRWHCAAILPSEPRPQAQSAAQRVLLLQLLPSAPYLFMSFFALV